MSITDHEDIESKWYQALFEEDCLAVIRLLNDHPSLLRRGMESEPLRQVEGRRRREGTGQTRSAWKGRTALHVGASRGCLQLIMQVLRLCNLYDVSLMNKVYQQRFIAVEEFSFNKVQVHPNTACDLCNACPILGNRWKSTVKDEYDLCPICYEQHGNEKEFRKIEYGLPHGPAGMDTIPSTKRRVPDIIQEKPSQSADSALDAWNSGDATVEIAAGQSEITDNQVHEIKAPFTSDSSNDSMRTEKPPNSRLSDKDVRNLLHAKDGESGLNALAIAALSNQDVMVFLWCGMEACDGVRQAPRDAEEALHKLLKPRGPREGDDYRKRLRQVMVDVALKGHVYSDELKEYYEHRDFNFLPPEEYLFHFSFAKNFRVRGNTFELWKAIRLCGDEVWRFVLELQDAQGRTPFHVAMDESNEGTFLQLVGQCESVLTETGMPSEVTICALTASDNLGRTPVHRAAAKGLPKALGVIFEYADEDGQVAYTYNTPWRADILNALPSLQLAPQLDYDFSRLAQDEELQLQFPLYQSPIHVAIIHGNFDCAKLLIGKCSEDWDGDWDCMAYRSLWGIQHWSLHEADKVTIMDIFRNKRIMPIRWVDDAVKIQLKRAVFPIESQPIRGIDDNRQNKWIWIEWHLVELACLVGAPEWFLGFLMGFFKVDVKKPRQPYHVDLIKPREPLAIVAPSVYEEEVNDFLTNIVLKNLWHPVHLVASSGKYETLNYFINDLKLTPFVDDFEGNSPLHHVMKVRELEFQTHLFDYVNAEHVELCGQCTSRMAKKQILEANPLAQRKGCINLLLEAGCEIFKANKNKQLPYPRGTLNDAGFLFWWYTKKQEEFNAQQSDLNFATNAIAVTATLVATASYVGPLQPPMGYDANQIQYENVWVSIFIVCDTLSFYFAIVAITLALIPALPMPQQAMLEELQRTRGMVIWAVGVLLPSIFFVFVAFASSSISVMSANITLEAGGILTILSTVIGVILCFLAFTLFSIRLLAFVYPKNTTIRYIYDLSNYVTKFSEQ